MSFKLIAEVWRLELTPTQQHVLMAMADYADDDGRNCFPSHKRLAWKLGCTTKTIARIIPELIGLGIVEVIRPATNKTPPRYQICLDKGTLKAPYEGDFGVDNLSTQDDLSPQNVHSRVDNLSARVDKLSTDPISNLSTNQPGKNGDALFSEMEKENAPELTAAETTRRWGECVKELGVEHRTMGDWLQGSELMATGGAEDGKPLYRLSVVNARSVDWLRHKGRRAICDSLRGVLGRAVAIEIISELPVTP